MSINKNMCEQELLLWMKQRAKHAKYFLTLNFSCDVSRQQAEDTARAFSHRVSVKIAGKPARIRKYLHPMLMVAEQQPTSKRWHLHVLINDIPEKYMARARKRGQGLKLICAQAWNTMKYTGKTSRTGGESERFVAGRPIFICEWFKPITDFDKIIKYVSKTHRKEGSDFLVVC